MTPPYSYNCTDKSVLLPHYKKYFVSFFFRFVPRWLTANFITLISTGFVFIMLFASFRFNVPGSPIFALICAVCLHTYVLGDHLDGMQAKESKTSSPLGEFLDHHLDVYNGAIVFYAISIFLGPIPDIIFLVLMVLNCTAFAATMVEELECRVLIFGYLGTLEALILLIIFLLTWLITPVREMWQQEIVGGYPAYWIMIILFGLGYLITIIDILLRMRRFPKPFAFYCLINLGILWLLALNSISQFQAWLILTLFGGEYIARVMRAHLLSGSHPYPDLIASGMFLLALSATPAGWLGPDQWSLVVTGITAWLAIKLLYSFGVTVFQMREHWYWVNP